MKWMNEAILLAQQGRTRCMPNPMVGCVIVKNNQVIGAGAHLKAGNDHAEITALAQAGNNAIDADLYVTLEPCSHFGRTPPCVDALLQSGIKSVHIALQDPNPLVSGKGIKKLRDAGIPVTIGECEEQAYQLNKVFFHYITHKQPFVIAKWAMSLNGKIAGPPKKPRVQITSNLALTHAHNIRAHVGGIMVGANTVITDNPQLNVRNVNYNYQPRPIIITDKKLPLDRHIFESQKKCIVIGTDQLSKQFLYALDKKQIEHYELPLTSNHISINTILDKLYALDISSILVEGGNYLLTKFFEAQLINKMYTYIAPIIINGHNSLSPFTATAIQEQNAISNVRFIETIQLGQDICYITESIQTPETYNAFLTCKGFSHVQRNC